ncbi:MAG: transposase, partial [Firmicutes bacterium]|nr:transposase [Bacillota bacterium]
MSEYHMDGHEGKAEDALERFAREGARRMLAAALEQEVAEFLGRGRYERGEGKRAGYRNGYHRPREVAVGLGRVQIRAPRVRDTTESLPSPHAWGSPAAHGPLRR